jgi:asparagine synthase (glutamine-hydrolysing)
MCGIAGFYGTRDIPDAAVDACLGLMKQRGPDASGVRRIASSTGRRGVMLHTRLSIIDLDPRANQPFNVGRKWLAYNGEVYNYLELRETLESRGVRFATTSDTEVLLAALDRDGMNAIDRCEGMWSFVMFDEADGSLTLCRDRFGEKPLYIYRAPEGIYFGSEVKFLFALMGRVLPVNRQHLMRYLVNGYKALYGRADCFFEGLDECAPATWLCIDSAGKETAKRYWNPAFSPDDQICRERAVEAVRERLIESVRMRLRSDVPLAFLMSGGVDSNALISIAKRVLKYDVHGFTIMSDDPRYDEGEIVRDAVGTLGVRHTAVHVTTKDFLPRLRQLVNYHDAPVFTITYYVQWLLMEHVKRAGYKISISGTAADELFSGYYDHYLMYLAEMHSSKCYASSLAAWQQHIQPSIRNPHLSDPDLFRNDPEFREHIFLNNDAFAQYLVPTFCEEFREHTYTSRSLLRNRMMNEMFHEAVPVILHEDDLNAMYFSIENRSPFLDRDLFELCYRIPTAHLMRDGFNKAILRDAVRSIAPDSVVNQRRKTGFNAPVESFLDLSDPSVKRELLADGPVFSLIKRDKIAGLLEKRNLPNSESKFLFYFVNAKLFLERFAN